MQLSPVTFAVNLECVSGQTTPEPRAKKLLRMSYVLVINVTNAQDPFSFPFSPPLVACRWKQNSSESTCIKGKVNFGQSESCSIQFLC